MMSRLPARTLWGAPGLPQDCTVCRGIGHRGAYVWTVQTQWKSAAKASEAVDQARSSKGRVRGPAHTVNSLTLWVQQGGYAVLLIRVQIGRNSR